MLRIGEYGAVILNHTFYTSLIELFCVETERTKRPFRGSKRSYKVRVSTSTRIERKVNGGQAVRLLVSIFFRKRPGLANALNGTDSINFM